MPTRCIPRVRRGWERNMVPNFPAPIRPTVTGRPAASRSSSKACRFTSVSFRVRERDDTTERRGRTTLLADRARDERLVGAFLRVGRTSLAPHLCRAFEGRRDVEAGAALKALRLAQRYARDAAIRRAVRRRGAQLMARDDVRPGEPRDRSG